MPQQQPICPGEYWWRQDTPEPVAVLAGIALPGHFGVAVSCGAGAQRQALSLRLGRSDTGLEHLVVREFEYHSDAAVSDNTCNLFVLLLNTLVVVLQRHCPPQLSLSGRVPTQLGAAGASIELIWELFGLQMLGDGNRGQRRLLGRVRNLRVAAPATTSVWPPQQLPWREVLWQPLPAQQRTGNRCAAVQPSSNCDNSAP